MTRKGAPLLTYAGVQIGTNVKGQPIYKQLLCELWELDGYETGVPKGMIPIFDEVTGRWTYTAPGSKDDPYKQLGMKMDNAIQF